MNSILDIARRDKPELMHEIDTYIEHVRKDILLQLKDNLTGKG